MARSHSSLEEQVAELPTSSGVYLFKGHKGRVLYVGKAANLRVRVRQYLAGHDERMMVPFLVRQAQSVDVVVTETEKEALLLENTLIKKHRPRYNVKLRDDSNFLHLRIDLRSEWPRYTLVRTIKSDGARYFGPYASASRARQTLAFLQRVFPLRTCTDQVLKSRRRPCLLHQMGRCVAPCVDGHTNPDAYAELCEGSMMLLDGKRRPLIRQLKQKMRTASDTLEFEQAARYRDLMRSVEATIERQQVVDPKLADRDIWGLFRAGDKGAVAIIPVREGAMGQPRSTVVPGAPDDDAELLSSLVNNAYVEGAPIPPEILLPTLPSDHEALAEILSERKGRRVAIRQPQRGSKAKLVALAIENARVRYLQETDASERHRRALEELARVLRLSGPPHRIECFDNSNLQGTSPVAAMSVFIDGKPSRQDYRRYRIKTVVGADDYASMREILERRFKRVLDDDGPRPDLVVIDGGKGQLGAAMAALEDLGVHDQAMIGLSKPRTEKRKGQRGATDKVVLADLKDPLRLPAGHPGLRILQHIRDEAHNHAIRYHRKVRSKNNLVSLLEAIPGVGPGRRKVLLRSLGSLDAVADATEAQLSDVKGIGPEMARAIYAAFHPQDTP